MDAVVRWSPHATPQQPRFVILNLLEQNLRFLQAEQINGSKLEYRQLSQRSKLPTIRAFDWSPTEEGLVAFGLPSGEAALLRIDDDAHDLVSFTVKHQRLCNAVSLSTKGLLAAGLDKVRNDFCLNIWDVNQRLSSWNANANEQEWTSSKTHSEPIRKLATSETISSIKFFADQPDSLVTGVKGQFVRIYDLRESPGNPSVQFATRCAHSLSIDPLDENYFASASGGGEPLVCVWDRRVTARASAASLTSGSSAVDSYQAGAVLELRDCLAYEDPTKAPVIWSVRYCKYKRATLGILGSNGQLQVYETEKDYVNPALDRKTQGQSLLSTTQSRQIQYPYDDVAHGGNKETRVVSFDFIMANNRLLAYRADGNLELFSLKGRAPLMDVSVRGAMATAHGNRDKIIEFRNATGLNMAGTIKNIRARLAGNGRPGRSNDVSPPEVNGETSNLATILSRRQKWEECHGIFESARSRLTIRDVFALRKVEQRRAREGYQMDCLKNTEILSDDPWLQDLWHWLDGADEVAEDGGMMYKRLDLSFLGVHAIWKGELGPFFESRITDKGGSPPTKEEFVEAVAAINHHQNRSPFDGVKTAYAEQRQLCLAICGWAMSPEEFEAELRLIERDGPRVKAAAWAMFHDRPKRAIEALFKGSDSEKLVAMALAGYYGMSGQSKAGDEDAWAALCRQVADTAQDPWSRAILALVSTGDWASVIAEESLPLRDRVGVALRYSPDERLDTFLEEYTVDCMDYGDMEGICLTGLTEEAIALFQNYMLKTGDVQTAVLAMSFTVPLYLDSLAFHAWREAYRTRLDRYELHVRRALYDMQHTKKSRARDGRMLINPPPRQVTVRCNFCDQSIAHDESDLTMAASASSDASSLADAAMGSSGVHVGNPLAGPGSTSGTTCPRCHHHLPRCGVCLMWLGVPDPRRSGGSSAVDDDDAMANLLNFCNTCHHGYHASHAREWFARHKICPVPECTCLCGSG